MIDYPDDREPHAPHEDSPDAAWSPDFPLGDPDAWRDGAHDEDASDADAWRGGIHLPPWPEWSAGPEYRMWKESRDEGTGNREQGEGRRNSKGIGSREKKLL